MSSHLSELCKASEVGPIVEQLKQLCPQRLNFDTDEEKEEVPVASGFTRDAHERMRCTFEGIWGYQDDDGRTALHWAVAMQNFALAHTLMKAPYFALALSEDHDGVSPFITACMVAAPEEFLRELLETAAAQRSWKVIREQDGMNTTLENATADVCLRGAAIVDNPLMEQELVILNQADSHGNTPLLHAAGRGKLAIVRFLLQLGASIDHQNRRGQSALHRATSRGATDVVEELVATSQKVHSRAEHRRWMNLQDYRGNTTLFYASMDNNEELGRYLLRHGVDREIKNKEGKEFWEV
ncbi:26S proteasome non-ATPase regulatory subunit 10 [Trypanosoma rangeli]|uniref:26S proteasome non-ATPase regulatory subunit 10 n=1 Tax=Trypanosoma rangeli TaxID=5698 RepID=A0A422P0K3_TRYRA|nr:26S proteasome non-ATPase regulatory subunit 10 [Trypanosoma rangeli]RNF11260.1 26S proteasome non-ATPase regulatory subunit 10 [Trypanosoma rangeli]|eukprot:RNF11260.1 26S proteasome non-ATPase regulatory subunit 10 [Trypanosoma rangeli]